MDSSFSLKAEDVHDYLSGTFTGTIFHLQVEKLKAALDPFNFVFKKKWLISVNYHSCFLAISVY